MTFTDEDLKRLKELWPLDPHKVNMQLVGIGIHFGALIARLEAAEHWARVHNSLCTKVDCDLEARWRKAAGKEYCPENP